MTLLAAVLLPWLLGAGCGASEALGSDTAVPLRVDITALPSSAYTLEPQVALGSATGWRMGQGLRRSDLSTFPTRDKVFLDLLLPSEASGQDVAIAVRVQDQSNRLVALGSVSAAAYPGARTAMAVLEVSDSRDTTPMLVEAKPRALARSKMSSLFLYGWGFHPQAKVTLDGQEVPVTWRSVALLSIAVPANTLQGVTATLIVTNPDQRSDTRSDLLAVGD
jgi:hypothetical protein